MHVFQEMLTTYFEVDWLTLTVSAGQMSSTVGGNAWIL